MKKLQFLATIVAIATILVTGCKNKKNEVPTPATINPSSTAAEFFANNGAKKQNFTVNVDNNNAVITGSEGSTITIPKDAFVTASGQPVTGEVSIELVEIFDQAGMVLSDRPTTSNGQLLVSGGEIYIGATADGQQLELNENTSILISLPEDTMEAGMTVFTGNADSSQFNWTVVPDVVPVQQNPNTGGIDSTWANDSTSYFYYDPSNYIFSVSTLGWINCDRFYNAPSTTDISIACSGIEPSQNTRVYLVFKNINSVIGVWNNPSGNVYNASYVPVGEEVTIIVFSLHEGKEYVGTADVAISANLSTTVQLSEATEAEIVELIKSKVN